MNVFFKHTLKSNKIINVFTLFILSLIIVQTLSASSYAVYPDLRLDGNLGLENDELNITGDVCYNCIVTVFINDERFTEEKFQSDLRVINWEDASDSFDFVANERFQINFSSEDNFNISVFGQDEQSYSAGELSEEYVFDSIDYDNSEIIVRESQRVFGTNPKSVFFDDSLREFSIGGITTDDLLSGDNTIRVVASADEFEGAEQDIEEEFTITIDKYPIKFEVEESDSLIANLEGSNIVGSVSNVEDYDSVGFAYLVNGPGEIISNTGLMRDFDVNESTGEFNISISSDEYREGNNTLDLIAYESENKGNFVGFNRYEVYRDTTPPEISIGSVDIFESGSRLVARFDGSEIGNQIFTGYSTIRVNVSVDAQDLEWEYDSSPRSEVVVNGSVELDIRAKQADNLVRDISGELSEGATIDEVVEELEVKREYVEQVKQAYEKLLEDGVRRNSQWYEQVATQYGIGYDLILTATDRGGNTATESITVLYNDEDPELVVDEMNPSSFFQESGRGEAFNSWATLRGRTNQPNVDVSFIVIGEDDFVDTDNGNRRRMSCDDAYEYYERGIWRNYDSSNIDEAFEDEESEFSYALQFADVIEFIRGELNFKSDDEGRFGSSSALQSVAEGEIMSLRTSIDPDKSTNTHDNRICVMMRNEYGRVNMQEFDVTYQGGNTDWNIDSVTFNKNSINPYEIEAEPENSRYRTSLVIEMDYVGQFGEEDDIQIRGVQVRKRGGEPRNIRVASSEVTYFYEGQTQKLNLYVPLEFSKRGIEVDDYPNSEDLTLEIIPRASVSGYDIDVRNPEFTQVSIDYDKNLLTDWLTPEMIDAGIDFLNTSVELTDQLRGIARKLVPVGYISCAGARVWHSIQTAGLSDDDPADREALEDAQEQLYLVCDRTFCTASPAECGPDRSGNSNTLMPLNEEGEVQVPEDLEDLNTYGADESKKTLRTFERLDVGSQCVTPEGKLGREASATVKEFEETESLLYEAKDATSEKRIPRRCVPYTYDQAVINDGMKSCEELGSAEERVECKNDLYGNEDNIQGLDVNSVQNSCYDPNPPHYDHTRTLYQPAMDPSDNILESVASGCIPETYQHLNQLYKIQNNIIDCLEDVKTGTVEGTYCERLVSVSLCDAVTGIVFRFSERRNQQREPRGDIDASLFGGLAQSQSSAELLDDRYEGQNYYSDGKIQTENIASSLCVFAINKDFTQLEKSLIGDLDREVEIAPQYTQTMPQVRFDGYNPLKGEITTAYQFTHNGISGGSAVKFTYELICDSSQENGEYCPEGVTTAQEIDSSTYRPIQKSVPAAGQSQEAIGIRDESAQYVFNVLKTTVEYTINDEKKTYEHEEVIQRGPADNLGSGPYSDCSFSVSAGVAGGGITCGSNFGSLSQLTYYQFMDSTQTVPSLGRGTAVFYEGDVVGVDVSYIARGDLQGNQRGTLWYRSSCENGVGSVPLDSTYIDSQNGNFYVELNDLKIPAVGSQATVENQDQNNNNNDNNNNDDDSQNNNDDNDNSQSNSNDDGFREGNCQLELRMTGNDIQLSQDTFEMDILEEEEIQTDTQTSREINDIYRTNYIVRSKPGENDKLQVDVISPREDSTIQVNQNGVPINSQIQIAGISNRQGSSIEGHINELNVELRLAEYSQDPLQFDVAKGAGYENLLVATHSSGQFSGIDFSTSRSATIIISGDGLDEDIRRDVSLRSSD
ncbi:MAG: hypothetical protein ACLFPL_00635 [Candidatus Nanoarchaeia archaeon]